MNQWLVELETSRQSIKVDSLINLLQMKILSLFTHRHVVPNLHVFLSSDEQEKGYFEECW